MSLWEGVLLGVLQGLTEFLPVSSSGHLALAQRLLPGFRQPGVAFDVVLHLGTALAVVWAERRQLVRWLSTRSGWRLLGLLALGTAATGAVGMALRAPATAAFGSPLAVGSALLVTGVVVLATRWIAGGGAGEEATGWGRAVAVGAVQGLAVFPGLSRSGTTIATGLATGLERSWAARFSFLLGVPAILAASVVELAGHRGELAALGAAFWGPALAGGVAAALAGYAALRVVLATVSSRRFHRFGWYCLALGGAVVALAAGGAP